PTGATGATGATGQQGPSGPHGPSGPAGPSYSTFEVRQIQAVSTQTTVISMAVNPTFTGNLLLQASGFVSLTPANPTRSGCQPLLDGNPIGNGTQAWIDANTPQAALAVTGAAAISAGNHTVTVVCSATVSGTAPNVFLDAFAV